MVINCHAKAKQAKFVVKIVKKKLKFIVIVKKKTLTIKKKTQIRCNCQKKKLSKTEKLLRHMVLWFSRLLTYVLLDAWRSK